MDDSVALMFNNALQKIYNLSSRKSTELREACRTAQDAIRDSPLFSKHPSSYKHDPKEYEILSNKLFLPLKLACHTKEPKIMTLAFDCFDKSMAYGIIRSYVLDESISTPTDPKKLIESIVNVIGFYFNFQDETVQLQIIKSLLTAVITPTCDVHDTCLMSSIKTCYNIYLITLNKVNITAAKNVLFQMVDFVLQRFESVSQSKMAIHANKLEQSQIDEINSNYQSNLSDVNLLFRAFCKLSTKDDVTSPNSTSAGSMTTGGASGGVFGVDSQEMKSKMLSLELLSRILESPLPSLKLSEKFINHSIKRYLSSSLLHNGTSQQLPVFKLTLTLFQSLIIHFKEHLKEEIGLFFSKILLQVLSSNQHSAKQKWLILPVLYEICKNPQTIVDIFVNYDCDPERKDIFEKMVYELSRVAQGTITGEQRSSNSDDNKFKILGLECIVTIMKSLVDWSKELYSGINVPTASNSTNTLIKKNSHSRNSSTDSELSSSSSEGNSPRITGNNNNTGSVLEIGISKFNKSSSKKAIEYLIKNSLIRKDSAEDISRFLIDNSEELDQKKIAEFFSTQQSSFSFAVLYKYIESFQFNSKEIDEALLELISNFLLINSENQIIDKIVEKFAEKYYNDNNNNNNNNGSSNNNSSNQFSNAETIYLLSYTIIILATDLHNPSIKSKISKDDWLKMNTKINEKKDLPQDYLLGIYDRVLNSTKLINIYNNNNNNNNDTTTIQQQNSSNHSSSSNSSNNIEYEDKFMRFNRESDYIAKQCQELIKAKLSKKSIFYKARNIEHVRPMFLLSWCYVLSTLSVVLDDTKDKKLISLCLEGFTYAIRVSCIFYLNVERSSFITSLSKFSLLDIIKEPTIKNIECVRTLLNIGLTESNYLSDSWSAILKSIFILERLHLIDQHHHSNNNTNSLGNKSPILSSQQSTNIIEQIQSVTLSPQKQQEHLQNMISSGSPTLTSSTSSPIASLFSLGQSQSQQPQQQQQTTIPIGLQKLIEEFPAKDAIFDSISIEKIFSNTIYLSDDSIVTFFKCLCEVSDDEINHYQKNYSLVKLVECIEMNFKRIRLVFYNIWEIVVQHFIRIGTHSNNDIALHAIDSLRQLATKYLEKQELSHYNFQNEFLTPFESIIRNNPSPLIQEHTIRCISQLSLSKTLNIKSGWKTIFKVLQIGAEIQNQSIAELSFNSIDQIIQKNSSLLLDSTFSSNNTTSGGSNSSSENRVFMDIINCLTSFINPKVIYFEISLKSLSLLEKLIQLKFVKNNKNNNNTNDTIDNTDIKLNENEIKLLYPIISGLSLATLHENEQVRSISIDLLFKTLNRFGNSFSKSNWLEIIQNTLKANLLSFDLQKRSIGSSEIQWIKKTLPVLFENLLNLFSKFKLVEFYGFYLEILEPFLYYGNELNFQAASYSFIQFIHTCHIDFNEEFWNENISQSIQRVLTQLLISKAKNNQHIYNFTKTLLSLSPIQVDSEHTENIIELEFSDNIQRFENTEPVLSIYNWQTAIAFMQKITNLFIERYQQQELLTPQKFTIQLIKTFHQVYLLSLRINSEMTFLSFFGEMNSQSFETSSLSCLLNVLFEIYLNDTAQQNQNSLQNLVEVVLENLSIGLLQEFSLNQFNSIGLKMIKIICLILQGFSKFSEAQFKSHLPLIYPFIVDFSLHENVEIRSSILQLLKRISKSLPTCPPLIETPDSLPLEPQSTTVNKSKY